MMDVMSSDVVDAERKAKGEAGMIQRSEDPTDGDEEEDGTDVTGHEDDDKEVKVLADDELKRVHVDGVVISTRRRDLPVMMFMDIFVDASQVEESMEGRIEKVIQKKETDETSKGV